MQDVLDVVFSANIQTCGGVGGGGSPRLHNDQFCQAGVSIPTEVFTCPFSLTMVLVFFRIRLAGTKGMVGVMREYLGMGVRIGGVPLFQKFGAMGVLLVF